MFHRRPFLTAAREGIPHGSPSGFVRGIAAPFCPLFRAEPAPKVPAENSITFVLVTCESSLPLRPRRCRVREEMIGPAGQALFLLSSGQHDTPGPGGSEAKEHSSLSLSVIRTPSSDTAAPEQLSGVRLTNDPSRSDPGLSPRPNFVGLGVIGCGVWTSLASVRSDLSSQSRLFASRSIFILNVP